MAWQRYYPRSQPREVEGGIKAHSKRGAFGESWWAQRWISVLESFRIGKRLARGKRYARKGQVMSIDVDMGIVQAEVQGSRKTPYEVSLEVPLIPEEMWQQLTDLLSDRAVYAARLLAGTMPDDIEECFEEVGTTLFPQKHGDLKTHCTCPDSSNPCKHIAAVYYLLGEQFDRDPFLMFKLRGMEREQLLAGLHTSDSIASAPPSREMEELPVAPDDYWDAFEANEMEYAAASVPNQAAELPNRLGPFPFWRSDLPFLRKLEIIYENAAGRGLRVATGGGD